MLFEGKSKCETYQKIVISKENRNEHHVRNESRSCIYQYRIDGDIEKRSTVKKCDYMVEVCNDQKKLAFVIELKGSDLRTALQQIEATIELFSAQLAGYALCPRIILHRIPTHDIHGSDYRKFKKKYPDIVVKEKKYVDTV